MKKNVLEKINEVFANNKEIIIVLHTVTCIGGVACYDTFEFGFDEYDSKVFEEEYNLSKYNAVSAVEDTKNNIYHIMGI